MESMTTIAAITCARNFKLSKRFYRNLEFEVAWSPDGLALSPAGNSTYLLRNFIRHLPVQGS